MLSSERFSEFYAAIHDEHEPFPWQRRLVDGVFGSPWPEKLAIPTGCGKTSVLDAAVFALAAQSSLTPAERSPLRIFFVVDRRLVVDDVSRHAQRIREALTNPQAPVLVEVREALCSSFQVREPLQVSIMRGGMYRSDAWADAPNQPAICVSTVDQLGSRLLFRGYGISDGRKPLHAGLIGNDSLIFLDEAHLSTAFLDTLRQVVRLYQNRDRWAPEAPAPGIQVVAMSATLPGAESDLTDKDREHGLLKLRLGARKVAELREISDLVADAAAAAIRLGGMPGRQVIGVVLNTVGAARATFEKLPPGDSILLTGRVRPYDRDQLLREYLPRIRADRKPRDSGRLFVVATQTVEVGADLDFDALVTEAAPIDSLRQRFGRLDRLGELLESPAVILKPRKAKATETIYGDAVERTWDWLTRKAQNGAIDFGVNAMDLLAPDPTLLNEPKRGPVLFPMHLDAWAQTNPLPKPDPDIAPFLHGAGAQESADVQIVWRADLPENLRDWKDVIAAALPVSTEALPIPIWAVRSWLARKPVLALPDLEGINHADAEDNSEREYLIWRGPETVPQRRQVRPGDTVVVRSIEGGCDRFGWNPLSAIPVRDIGDQCANERTRSSGGRYHLRIHPDVLFPDRADLRIELWEALEAKAKDEPAADECIAKLLTTAGAQAASDVAWREGAKPYGAGTALIATSKWIRRAEEAPPVEAISSLPSAEPNETDEDDSGLAGEKVITLAVHTAGVRDKVSKFAAASGVSARICSVIDRAAEIHDIGKQDGRFQILLDHERNPADEPLAKSKQRLPVREYMRRRDDEAQYPHNARHEFMSVALADATGASGNSGDSDLLRYLVGTHHGYGRPLPPYWAEGEHMVKDRSTGIEVRADAATSLARADHGWPDLFRRLMERYGYWGLAYLEVMLRRADCVRSREEQDNK